MTLTVTYNPAACAQGCGYVVNFWSADVSIFSLQTNSIVGGFPLAAGADPRYVSIAPNGSRGYVGEWGIGQVDVFDVAGAAVVASVAVVNCWGLAAAPNGSRVYVRAPNSIHVVDAATNTVIATVPVSGGIGDVAVAPHGSFVYVSHDFGGTNLYAVNASTLTVVATIAVGSLPGPVAVSPNGSFVFVGNSGSASVSVVSTSSYVVVATIAVGSGAEGIAFTPNGSLAYVADASGASCVSVINTATNSVIASIAMGPSVNPLGVAVAPNGSFAYVALAGLDSVIVIDTTLQAIVATVVVGGGPGGIAIR